MIDQDQQETQHTNAKNSHIPTCDDTSLPKEHKHKNTNKAHSLELAHALKSIGYSKKSERINACSPYYVFEKIISKTSGQIMLKTKYANSCRVRYCETCERRNSRKHMEKFRIAADIIAKEYKTYTWLFLTLTIRNVPVENLKQELKKLNLAWNRLTKYVKWPAKGFAKSIEITRGKDGLAHPHIHALLLAPQSYFTPKNYLEQWKWVEMWRKALKADYDPIVDIRRVTPKKGETTFNAALLETFKYTAKHEHLTQDLVFLEHIIRETHHTRKYEYGGIIKSKLATIKEMQENDTGEEKELPQGEQIKTNQFVTFSWNHFKNEFINKKQKQYFTKGR